MHLIIVARLMAIKSGGAEMIFHMANAFQFFKIRKLAKRLFSPSICALPLALIILSNSTSNTVAQNDQKIENRVAVFSGIDKITGRIHTFDVYVNETVQFGALQVTPRVCFTRPLTETPKTTAFLEVDEITLDAKIRRIFNGWMFAASPGLNAIEHPVYDIWLKDCKMESDVPPPS